MMPPIHPNGILSTHRALTLDGAMTAMNAAILKALELDVPQNVAIVDPGGNLIAFVRMDGARTLARLSAISKAQTAVSLQAPTGHLPKQFGMDLSFATGGNSINMVGGLPIMVDGEIVGGVGVSSGTDDEDLAVATAACDAIAT